ncbi:MAG: hypothetical protein HOW73_28095 [Polyangiaceae bacterium]|nr:hypothetical protein [Polyangiaceae bacterium]
MTPPVRRALLLAVPLFAAIGCSFEAQPETFASTPAIEVVASPSASASASAGSAIVDAVDEPGAQAPGPAAYARYEAEVDRKCPRRTDDGSTWGMVGTEIEYANCQATVIEEDQRKLSVAARAVLLDGDPSSSRGPVPDPVDSLWRRTVDAAANVEDAQEWVDGSLRVSGTMAHNVRAWRLVATDRTFGVVARARLEDRAADVVEIVVAQEKQRPLPAVRLAKWKRYAALARRTAPHRALPDPDIFVRKMNDADWIALERDIDASETGATKLAEGLCREWAALRAALPSCETRLRILWLPSGSTVSGDTSNDPAEDAQADPPDTGLAPPADEPYDSALVALRGACRLGEERKCIEDHVARVLSDPEIAALPGITSWRTRTKAFRERLCAADATSRFASFSHDTEGWLAAADPRSNCFATGALLESYLLGLAAKATNSNAITEHVSRRVDWGKRVRAQLETIAGQFAKPCEATPTATCDRSSPKQRSSVAGRLHEIIDQSETLAKELCTTTALAPTLGADCEGQLSAYLLSYAGELGKPDLLE